MLQLLTAGSDSSRMLCSREIYFKRASLAPRPLNEMIDCNILALIDWTYFTSSDLCN